MSGMYNQQTNIAEDCPGVELNNARMVICMHNVTFEDRTAIEEHER